MLICVQVGISRGTTWVGLKIRKIENVLFYVDLSVCVCVCVWTLGDGLKIEKEEIKKIEYLGITFYKVYNDINHV